MPEQIRYDEFGLFHENAAEYGLPYPGPPDVRRVDVEVAPGRTVSSLLWGTSAPEVVLVHGGAQNAHTWDTVALALGRPLLAVDLPGHGHSDGGPEGSLSIGSNGRDLATVVAELAPDARGVVGMSLGGMSSIALAAQAPELVRALVLVDITPGVNAEKAAPVTNFVNGPASFDSFEELLARTMEHNPTRSESSLRRGILHNAVQREDGTWVWRYARFRTEPGSAVPDFADWWEAVSGLRVPILLVRGLAWSVVDDRDVDELLRRQPSARVVGIEGAGHSIQGDRPLELAAILDDFLFPGRVMDPNVWFSRRALKLHAVILILVPAFLALCAWQLSRALGGNSLSWAYVFEWPIFAGYAVYMWWRLVHEGAEDTPPPGAPGGRTAAAGPEPAAHAAQEEEDADLAAYNAYLAQLAERDRATES